MDQCCDLGEQFILVKYRRSCTVDLCDDRELVSALAEVLATGEAGVDTRPRFVHRYWKKRNERAGLRLDRFVPREPSRSTSLR